MGSKLRFMVQAAVIAAAYVAVTLLLAYTSFGPVQLRFSEALCALALYTPAAVPGLFIGCVIANLLGSSIALDIVVGGLITLAAAALTYRWRKKPLLALAPPVVLNAAGLAALFYFVGQAPFWLTVLTVGAGQLLACYGLGLPLAYGLRKVPQISWEYEKGR
ncbi:QueT transporter family protein [Gehongia tenuis]|uniref:QueT transporter family protein n=1 Tax=Gehongia tenuis TaxID=2763655 RepID=A0A926D416_9FIRM|nr:QueT transporter family protein [Gehongia tenuis]MBC8532000.1 QueT transporter family protein [Gehongia tenuis]